MSKRLAILFLVEVIVVVAVMFIFKMIENRVHAGLVAGSVFIALGLLIVGNGLRSFEFRKTGTFYLGAIHLGLIALPMFLTRLLNLQTGFSELTVWGLPGPVFHKLSTWFYMLLMITTLAEAILKRKKPAV
jgi:hypothetical protein